MLLIVYNSDSLLKVLLFSLDVFTLCLLESSPVMASYCVNLIQARGIGLEGTSVEQMLPLYW